MNRMPALRASSVQPIATGIMRCSEQIPSPAHSQRGNLPRKAQRASLLRRALKSESGAGTIEFVVLFPILVLIVLFIAWASAVISRASNIQEVAHDLARSALRHSSMTAPAGLCAKLEAEELGPAIRRSGETLPLERFTFTCEARANAPVLGVTRVEIALSYNAAGDAISDLGRSFGWNIARIERRSVMLY